MDNEIIRGFIIDRNAAWREAIDDLLNRQPDIEVVGTSSDLSSALPRLLKLKPDVVLIDNLPSSEIELAIFGQLKRSYPQICFVLHAGYRQDATMPDLIKAGMSGCLPKGSSPRKIVQAVRQACHDQLERQGAIFSPAA